MPDPVSSVNSSSHIIKPSVFKKDAKASPLGIAANDSSIESIDTALKKSISQRIKDSFFNIIQSIKDFFRSIIYRLFFCKAPPTKDQDCLLDFQARLDRVDQLSGPLAEKEANKYPVVYTMLGKKIYRRNFYNLPWILWVSIPYFNWKNYSEIGRKEAAKDNSILIPILKEYYQSEVESYKRRVSIDQNLD